MKLKNERLQMNPRFSFLMGAAIVSVALPGYSADPYDTGRSVAKSDQRIRVPSSERLAYPTKASEIAGMEVNNLQNQKLGKVDELGIDVESGRVAFVVVSSGGVLGVGGKTVAVPPRSFSYDPATKNMRLDVDKERFKAAPVFEMSKWDESSQSNRLIEAYGYYGQQPYFAEMRNDKAPAGFPSKLEKASKVIGMPVVNKEDKKCGVVDNLIVDLPMGRIVHLIVSSGGFLGIGDALNAIPPRAFRFNASRDSLLLDISKEELTRAPYFKSSEWPNFQDPTYSSKVYRSYGVDPYFSADADNTARNVRDRKEDRPTPLDQGSSDADVQTTRRIRQEILAKQGLSVNARNVKVMTVNGRVTLRGPVNDDIEKQAIVEIANRIAESANVDNQLEVKREPYNKE
jgi:sporulation protein YlmC with PRC-barrel domain